MSIQHRIEFSRPGSLGVVELPAIELYLQQTLRRLLNGTGVPPGGAAKPVQIAISAKPGYQGWVADQTIYLPWTLLPELATDDEVAALVAHEASHLLLDHAALDAKAGTFGILSAFGPVLVTSSPVAMIAAMIGGQYGDRVVAGRWARGQELEADALGVQLLVGAGYRPAAMSKLLDNLEGLVERSPSRRPGPVQEVQRPDGRTEYTINLGGLRFGQDEDSHPDYDQRREQLVALQGRPTATLPRVADAAEVNVPARSWASTLAAPEVQRAFQGLQSAAALLRALRSKTPPSESSAAQLAREVLGSPVGDSFIAYWAAAAVLPESEMAKRGLAPILQRLDRPDVPIVAWSAILTWASKHNNWELAAAAADAIRQRYEPHRTLYTAMANAYKQRAKQIGAFRDANGNRLSSVEVLDLTSQQMKMDLRSFQARMICLGLARNPDELMPQHCER